MDAELACHTPFSFISSHHIPLLCHSPSTVRERLSLAVTVDFPSSRLSHSSARESSPRCEHYEQWELSDSELSQHASLNSWQKKSMAMWQLKVTRPKLPILEKERHHLAWPILPNDFNSPTLIVVLVHLKTQCALISWNKIHLRSTEGTSGHCAQESLPTAAKRRHKMKRTQMHLLLPESVVESKRMPWASPQEQEA